MGSTEPDSFARVQLGLLGESQRSFNNTQGKQAKVAKLLITGYPTGHKNYGHIYPLYLRDEDRKPDFYVRSMNQFVNRTPEKISLGE